MDRYNPQSIEKQACKWSALQTKYSLFSDLEYRLKQIRGQEKITWFFPANCDDVFDSDYIAEYGIDVCRMAILTSDRHTSPLTLLDSCYNRISKIYDMFMRNSSESFDSKYWLSALSQSYDHSILRNKTSQAIALINTAIKKSRPAINLSQYNKSLILSVLYPFIPILSVYLANSFDVNLLQLPQLFLQSNYTEVVFKMRGGGWHREVFSKNEFTNNPKQEFLKLKWIKKAVGSSNLLIEQVNGGLELAFSE